MRPGCGKGWKDANSQPLSRLLRQREQLVLSPVMTVRCSKIPQVGIRAEDLCLPVAAPQETPP